MKMARNALLFVLAISWPGFGTAADQPLFRSDTVLQLTMPVNFDALCRPSEDPACDFSPTTFEFRDDQGRLRALPIEIRRRDGWRALHTNCQIPTLFVRFPDESTRGTPFAGQTTLALTSHCGKGIDDALVNSPALPSEFERYVINEYLGYRMYNLFTDASLRVRLARITYVHPDESRRKFTRDAFFAEHFESLAQRLNARLLPAGSFDPDRLDRASAARVALFEYMIGNTDWSIEEQNNVILLRDQSGVDTPVLFDLDQSGLVNAHYASPAPDLPIHSVKQRYFTGFCGADGDWDAVFSQFAGLRSEVLALLDRTPGLGRGDRRVARAFLDDFFELIESPAARRKTLTTCRPWPERPGRAPVTE